MRLRWKAGRADVVSLLARMVAWTLLVSLAASVVAGALAWAWLSNAPSWIVAPPAAGRAGSGVGAAFGCSAGAALGWPGAAGGAVVTGASGVLVVSSAPLGCSPSLAAKAVSPAATRLAAPCT